MLMFVRSIDHETSSWRVCTRAVEYCSEFTRPGGQRWRYQLVEMKSWAPYGRVRLVECGWYCWACLHDAAGDGNGNAGRWTRRNKHTCVGGSETDGRRRSWVFV
jgi:hypothetical protein